MSLLLHTFNPKPFAPLSALNPNSSFHPFSIFLPQNLTLNPNPLHPSFFISSSRNHIPKPLPLFALSSSSSQDPNPNPNPNFKRKIKSRRSKPKIPEDVVENSTEVFPTTIPRKPRRGRKSEAAAVEDFIRNSLERTFKSIREQNSEILEDKEKVLKDKINDEVVNDDDEVMKGKKAVVEEDDPNWPLDADVGWGTRASEYFDNHPIKNVVGEDGVEIDWEGELDDSWVKEINCLEWESFAFHPSPLIVLVFERYNRASDNWKVLKELEKAIKVYWNAKDRLPPRAVKIDINIERDLAYALKVKEGPQLLFLRGNRITYREKEIRTTDELVHMIAYFYYNAKKPSWINDAALAPY